MMPLSKLWLFLATLALGLVVLLVLMLSSAPPREKAERQGGPALDLARQAAIQILDNSNRLWLDAATQLSNDAVLSAALEEIPRGQAELPMLHLTAKAQLAKLNETLQASFLILTDARGRVLARLGQDEAVYKDSIAHLPLLAEALRGVRRDDLWFAQSGLYRVAGAPVASAARDRYVGGLLIGQAISDELAAQIQASVGGTVVFVCDGRVVAASVPRERLPAAIGQLVREVGTVLKPGGHTEPLVLPGGQQALLAGLHGEASAKGAMLVLLGPSAPRPPPDRLATFLDGLSRAELPALHLGLLLCGVALMLLIGLLLVRHEADRPFAQLEGVVQKVATGQADLVHAGPLRGRWRELASSINEALMVARAVAREHAGDQPVHVQERITPPPSATIPAALQLLPTPSMATPSGLGAALSGLRPSAPPMPMPARATGALPREVPAPAVPSAPLEMGMHAQGEQGAGQRVPKSPQGGFLVSTGYVSLEPETSSARTVHDLSLEQEFMREPSQRSPLPELPTVRDIPNSVVQAALEHALGVAPAPFRARVPTASYPRPSGPLSGSTPPPRSLSGWPAPLKAAAPAPEGLAASRGAGPTHLNGTSEEDLEAAFRQTYQEFVITKQRCNEPIEGLTYDKFALKLRQSRDQIMQQHGCKSVRFHVYVKEGKAALKATPVAY